MCSSIERLWNRVEDWELRCKEWYSLEFSKLDVETCYDTTRRLVEELREIRESLGKENEVLSKLEEEVTSLKGKIPCIRDLRSGSLKDRHWKMIAELMGMDGSVEEMTLEYLDQYGAYSYHKEIRKITRSAVEEEKLDNLIGELNNTWTGSRVETKVRHGILIVDGFDSLFDTLEAGFMTLRQLGKSRYVQQFNDRLLTWSARLEFVRLFVELLKSVQNEWAMMEVPFSCLMFKEEHPGILKFFHYTKSNFLRALNAVIDSPNILESFHNEDSFFILTDVKLHLSKLYSYISGALKATRFSSPRLFFLSDEQLLGLLEHSTGNISELNKYLPTMFTSIQRVIFEEQESQLRGYNPLILGVVSKEGETLLFDEPVKARLDVSYWVKTIDKDVYRCLLLELQEIMRNGCEIFPQVWMDASSWLAQSQSTAAHVFWSQGKLDIKEMKDHCLRFIQDTSNSQTLRQREAKKLIQLLFYEQRSGSEEIKYVFENNRLYVSGFGASIQYGTEYLGYSLPFTPELHSYGASELFAEFGLSRNPEAQRLFAGILGKFYFCISHFNHGLNFINITLGTLKLGSWTFFRDFERVNEENTSFLKEISVYIQTLKDKPLRKRAFITIRGYEISISHFPRVRTDSKWGPERVVSLIESDFKVRLSLAFIKKGLPNHEGFIGSLVRISKALTGVRKVDFENKILNALVSYQFNSLPDFIALCLEKARVMDEMREAGELENILDDIWKEKIRVFKDIRAKMDSSFDLVVLSATELQGSVENFTSTYISFPESLTKRKIISIASRYLENQGYSIIKICPMTQVLRECLQFYINSVINSSGVSTVFLLNSPLNSTWQTHLSKLLEADPSLRLVLKEDDYESNNLEKCISRRRVAFPFEEDQEYKLIQEDIPREDMETCHRLSKRVVAFFKTQLEEHIDLYPLMSFALNWMVSNQSSIYKSLFISAAFHIVLKKFIDRLHSFFIEVLGVDPEIGDMKDPLNASGLALKFSFGVKNTVPVFYVPSREQAKVILYLKHCIESKLSVLLCGKRSAGKSTAVGKALKYMNPDKYETLFLNMSSIQSNDELTDDFFLKEDTLIVDKLRDSSHRTLVIIMVSFDVDNRRHGYFLRSIQEKSRLLWDDTTKKMVPLRKDNVVTIVELTLGSSPNSYEEYVEKMNQFTRSLHPIHLRKDDNENEMITKTILDKFITDFEKDVSDTSHSIPSLINSIHESFKGNHPHRVFDHNLFRVLLGILYADPETFVRGKDFGNHVYNEMRNEYIGYETLNYDIKNIDSKFSAKQSPKDVSSFKDSISYYYLEEGFIKVKMISLKDAKEKFTSAYAGIRGKTYNTRLVFSHPFTYLISNLIRSINKYGDILLFGKAGHGRRSCAEFVGFFLGIRLMEASGSFASFSKQLKSAYVDASNGEVILLLVKLKGLNNDSKRILRCIEEILFYGECHGLLSNHEMNEHLFDTDNQQYEANYNYEAYMEAKDALHESIREGLHFFICIEDIEVQSYICSFHPFLSQRCGHHEIDYWNEETLRSIAEDRFSGMVLKEGGSVSLDSTLRSLAMVSTNMHLRGTKSFPHFSFLNYLDTLRVLPNLYEPRLDELMVEINEVSTGISQVSHANELIHKLSDDICGQEPESSRISTEIERLQKRISQEKINLEKASKAFRKKEVIARKRSQETKELAQDAHQSLERALPGLESAMAGLHAIDKNEVAEIRSFKSPPETIQQVMEAVCILLGHKSDWNGAKTLLSDFSFIQRLVDFDKDNIPEASLKRIRRFVDNPKFIPDDIGKVSKAACTLCMWVRAVDLYATIFKAIEPKRIKLLQSESELVEAMTALRTETDRVAHIESSHNNLESNLAERIKKKESLSESLRITNIHLERAEHLSYSLEEECARWKGQLSAAERKLENLMGDSLLQSFIVGYCGNLSEDSRLQLLSLWKEILSHFSISYSERLIWRDPRESHKESRRWHECEYYAQNALISKYTNKWPLYIDPSNIALSEALLIGGHPSLLSSDPHFCKKLRSALNEGSPCIVKDFNFNFPPEFKNLFQRNLYEKVRVFVGLIGIPKMRKDVRVQLGTSGVLEEVAVGGKFHLYLHSSDKTFPLMDDKINAISYTLTKEALFLKLRKELMAQMDAAFAQTFDEIGHSIERMNKEVNAKIRNVLLVFIKSKDSMLENDRLIASLKDAKASVFENANTLAGIKKNFEESFVPKVGQFSSLASKLTSFCLLMEEFTRCEEFHQFSQGKILDLIQHGSFSTRENITNEAINILAKEFIFELCPHQRNMFKRALSWIKTLGPEETDVFVNKVVPRALASGELEGDNELRGIFNHGGEIKSDDLGELDLFNNITAVSANHPLILIDECTQGSLDIILDLLGRERGSKSSLRYLSLSPSSYPSSIDDSLRMAKVEKSWVVIQGLAHLDGMISKLKIPLIENNFRLFVLGTHGTTLHSMKLMSGFKFICTRPPCPKRDPLGHRDYLRSRLRLWRKEIHALDFFVKIFEWDETSKQPDHLQKLKVLIQKFDTPQVSQIDPRDLCHFFEKVYQKTINSEALIRNLLHNDD